MPPQLLAKLDQIGKKLVRWEAEQKLALGLSAVIGWVWALGLADLWLRLDRTGRTVTWTILLGLVVATLWLVRAALRLRFTPEAVAATVEKTFPQLDNRLINTLQFARDPDGDIFKAAYVRAGPPDWQSLDFRELRDKKARRRSRVLLGVAAALMVLPALFFGRAWAVAVWRTVNPFSSLEPTRLTKILDVQPGDFTVLQGNPLVLGCAVDGFAGHEVRIEIEPAGAKKSTFSLGRIKGGAREEFGYPIEKVTAGLRYRFLAGDAPDSAWFTIATRPPPAFTSVSMSVAPPAYTNLPTRQVNPREGRLTMPGGSELRIRVTANTPLKKLLLSGGGIETAGLRPTENPAVWQGVAQVSSGTSLTLKGEDAFGSTVEEEIPFQIEPDKPPGIEILSPSGLAVLPPGERPQIEFRVADDFGISGIAVEEVTPDATREDKGTTLAKFQGDGTREFRRVWAAESSPSRRGTDIAFRIVARDNRPGQPNETFSDNVVFRIPSQAEFDKLRGDLEKAALASLQKMIEMQRRNLADTGALRDALNSATAAQWAAAAERQKQIRASMRDLLANPLKPLGGLTNTAQKLYATEMVLATDALQSIPEAGAARKATLAAEAVDLEGKILKQLDFALAAMAGSKAGRSVSGLGAMLESMLRDQISALKQTRDFANSKAKVGRPLVDAQDRLGGDMAAFLASCKTEAAQAEQNDKGLAASILKMMDRANELKVRPDMVVAAERLDQNLPAEAVPPQERAAAALKSLQEMLDQVRLKQEADQHAAMLDAVKQAKDKIDRLKALTQKMQDAIEQVKGQKDKNDKALDEMGEDFAEMKKNIKDAMLQIPNDLHIFTDLNVANDLVADVFSVFQEIEQEKGSDKMTPDKVSDLAFAKDETMLAQMGEARKRIDDVETWLTTKPDDAKVTTESFDKAEMPKSGVALGELAAAAQDLVGDLQKEDEKAADKADDSATNHAMPDLPMGWDVKEGDIASFSAKGKSGNQKPDHKEQDGRSNVGRQGMSTGETAASSGTIGKGDDKIEARRTEDPTQSGQIDLSGEADTKATGGGKLGTGKADGMGMSGGAKRMDSKEKGSSEGMAALMAKRADELFAKASKKNVRVDSLKDAAHQLRQSADAIAKGDIGQMREFRKLAVTSLARAHAELSAGPSRAVEAKGSTGALDNVMQSGPDQAPQKYRDKVAEYYKELNGAY